MEDEAGTCACGDDAVGIADIECDALDVETFEVAAVAFWFDERNDPGASGEEGADHGRADEPGCPGYDDSIALVERERTVPVVDSLRKGS